MKLVKKLVPVYLLVIIATLSVGFIMDKAVTVLAPAKLERPSTVYIIDPGHGGIDGGATSCTGILESQLNLEIALRLNDLMHLLGQHTIMIRTTDKSVYTSGTTIAAQKASDLKQRVRIVNEIENGVLISIHQNIFSDGKYAGSQVFYSNDTESKVIAEKLQINFMKFIDPSNNRKTKPANGIYLMEHITQPGILIECGFLSNIEEEAKLRSRSYQMRMCAVIATTVSAHFTAEA